MEFYPTAPSHHLTYSDVFLVPSRSGVTSRPDVSLAPVEGHGIVLHDSRGRYVGCIAATRLATALPDARLGDLVHGGVASLDADDVDSPRRAFDLMVDAGLEFAPVLEHGRVVGTLSRRSALRGTIYEPNVDAHGRLRVAAAIGIN